MDIGDAKVYVDTKFNMKQKSMQGDEKSDS
jgi:hypothetical protein